MKIRKIESVISWKRSPPFLVTLRSQGAPTYLANPGKLGASLRFGMGVHRTRAIVTFNDTTLSQVEKRRQSRNTKSIQAMASGLDQSTEPKALDIFAEAVLEALEEALRKALGDGRCPWGGQLKELLSLLLGLRELRPYPSLQNRLSGHRTMQSRRDNAARHDLQSLPETPGGLQTTAVPGRRNSFLTCEGSCDAPTADCCWAALDMVANNPADNHRAVGAAIPEFESQHTTSGICD